MRSTDIFGPTRATKALDNYHRLNGLGNSMAQALRTQSEATQMYRCAGGRALAEEQRMLNQTVRAACDDAHLSVVGMTRTALADTATSASRMARLGLEENAAGIERSTGIRARETARMFDRYDTTVGRYGPVPESLAHASLARTIRDTTTARTTRFSYLDDALAGGPLTSAAAGMRDAVGIGSIFGRDGAARRSEPYEVAIEAGLREARAVVESVRLAGPTFGLAHASYGSVTLTSWQRAQLRSAERELRSAESALQSLRTTALPTCAPRLARQVQRQLADVRKALDADRLATRRAVYAHVAGSATPVADSPTGLLSSTMPRHVTDARASSMASIFALTDSSSWLTRYAARRNQRTSGLLNTGDFAEMRRVDAGVGSVLRSATGLTGGSLQSVVTDMRRLSGVYPEGLSLSLTDVGVGRLSLDLAQPRGVLDVLDALDAVAAFDAVEEEPSTDEEALAAVVALVMWSRAASVAVQSRGQLLTSRGRLLIAQTGAVLHELGVAVADDAQQAGEWVWTEPLWAVRALRELSGELTADERLGVRQRRRFLAVAVGGAAMASVFGPHFVGRASLASWGGIWAMLASFYEDIARLCRDHGRNELVPADRRL